MVTNESDLRYTLSAPIEVPSVVTTYEAPQRPPKVQEELGVYVVKCAVERPEEDPRYKGYGVTPSNNPPIPRDIAY